MMLIKLTFLVCVAFRLRDQCKCVIVVHLFSAFQLYALCAINLNTKEITVKQHYIVCSLCCFLQRIFVEIGIIYKCLVAVENNWKVADRIHHSNSVKKNLCAYIRFEFPPK